MLADGDDVVCGGGSACAAVEVEPADGFFAYGLFGEFPPGLGGADAVACHG